MKKRRGILYCLLAASMLVSLTGCSKGGSGTHLLVAHSHNENHPVHVALTYMKDEMENNTGYTFSIYPNSLTRPIPYFHCLMYFSPRNTILR